VGTGCVFAGGASGLGNGSKSSDFARGTGGGSSSNCIFGGGASGIDASGFGASGFDGSGLAAGFVSASGRIGIVGSSMRAMLRRGRRFKPTLSNPV
jgi:hypothetical protein